MQTIFAPWRMEYLMSDKSGECIFCAALRDPEAPESLIVHRRRHVFTILNRYPYLNGHVMVAPVRHVARLHESGAEERAELIEEVAVAQQVLEEVYAPAGFNVGANFGRAGGAGVEDHYHVHVVPRWIGDSNFMTVVGDSRIIPEDLGVSREKLAPRFAEVAARSAG